MPPKSMSSTSLDILIDMGADGFVECPFISSLTESIFEISSDETSCGTDCSKRRSGWKCVNGRKTPFPSPHSNI